MRIILIHKNFEALKCQGISHIGLGVCALNTSKVLKRAGIPCEVWAVEDSNQIRQRIREDKASGKKPPISHCVISAPWIRTANLDHLCQLFPHIEFIVNLHSNLGFLMADPQGTKLFREYFELQEFHDNFNISANSEKMAKFVRQAYEVPCRFLPNLYFLEGTTPKKHEWNRNHPLKIGIFGACRPLKNMVTAVGAAIVMGRKLQVNVEIFLSTGRLEGGSNTILNCIRGLVKDLKHVHLHEAGWHTWPEFKKLVSKMHLTLQPSYSESFNIVTADSISVGVPCVVSEAITWAPMNWEAPVDDAVAIADKGIDLLKDTHTAIDGFVSLSNYVAEGLHKWKKVLHKV